MFHRIEIDKEKIEAFVREGFEKKLGKDNVLETQLFSYPNELIVAVSVRKDTPETSEISHELRESLLNNGLSVMIYAQEAQP
jgi:hypothetical protein